MFFFLLKLKEDLERGINLPSITDDTDYIKTVERGIESKSDDLLSEEIKKLNASNERQIRQIDKKYEKMIKKINLILSDSNLTPEQKKEILSAIGYDEEIKPYLETRSILGEKLRTGDITLSKLK